TLFRSDRKSLQFYLISPYGDVPRGRDSVGRTGRTETSFRMEETQTPRHVRALFISDVHLGMQTIQIGELLKFLAVHDADTIYIVGDLIDGWRLQKEWHWPPEYDELANMLFDKARRGARMVYLAGNHDEFLRDY